MNTFIIFVLRTIHSQASLKSHLQMLTDSYAKYPTTEKARIISRISAAIRK